MRTFWGGGRRRSPTVATAVPPWSSWWRPPDPGHSGSGGPFAVFYPFAAARISGRRSAARFTRYPAGWPMPCARLPRNRTPGKYPSIAWSPPCMPSTRRPPPARSISLELIRPRKNDCRLLEMSSSPVRQARPHTSFTAQQVFPALEQSGPDHQNPDGLPPPPHTTRSRSGARASRRTRFSCIRASTITPIATPASR